MIVDENMTLAIINDFLMFLYFFGIINIASAFKFMFNILLLSLVARDKTCV